MTGTAAAQTKGRQLRALGVGHVEIITDPRALPGPIFYRSPSLSSCGHRGSTSHIHSPRPSTPGLVTEKNSLSRNFMTPSIMAVLCILSGADSALLLLCALRIGGIGHDLAR